MRGISENVKMCSFVCHTDSEGLTESLKDECGATDAEAIDKETLS